MQSEGKIKRKRSSQ